jgi:hypothetical protein
MEWRQQINYKKQKDKNHISSNIQNRHAMEFLR